MSGAIGGIGYKGSGTGILETKHHGQVLQTQTTLFTGESSVVGGSNAFMNITFNRISGGSSFMLNVIVTLGTYLNSVSQDSCNPFLALYVNNNGGGRQLITSNDSLTGNSIGDGFYGSDVPGWWESGVIYNWSYHCRQYNTMQEITNANASITGAKAGDTVIIDVEASALTGGLYLNRSRSQGASGGTTAMTLYEIAGQSATGRAG